MSDVLTERETLRQLMRQPGISIGAAFFVLGLGGLVAAVLWLSSLPASHPSTPRVVAEGPAKQAAEKPPSDFTLAAMPEHSSVVPKLSDSVIEQPELLPAPLPRPAGAEPQAATPEAAATTTGPAAGPLRAAEPVPFTRSATAEINPAPPDQTRIGMVEPPPAATQQVGYRLQLGSVRTPESARQEWARLEGQNGDLLRKLGYAAARVDLGARGIFYRIQAGPVADAAAADRACKELRRRGVGCILVKP